MSAEVQAGNSQPEPECPQQKPVTATAKLPVAPQPLAANVGGMQRLVLVLLSLAHLSCPFVWWLLPESPLLRDATFLSQISLVFILFAFGGLTWRGLALLAGLAGAGAWVWSVAYPYGIQDLILDYLVWPECVLILPFVVVRLFGFHGSWAAHETEISPWQISLRVMLGAMAVVAVSLSVASWFRQFPWINQWGSDSRAWLANLVITGCGDSLVCLAGLWAIGTRGAGWVKFLVLICGTCCIAGWQLYSLKMDDYWQGAAVIAVVWAAVVFGTLYIWRICGWHLVRNMPATPIIAN